jgi:hypothetical protein
MALNCFAQLCMLLLLPRAWRRYSFKAWRSNDALVDDRKHKASCSTTTCFASGFRLEYVTRILIGSFQPLDH